MADENNQNQGAANTAPIPEWLQKAQSLALKPESGTGNVTENVPAGQSSQAATRTSQTGVTTAQNESQVKSAADVNVDAPVPDWLKNAAKAAEEPEKTSEAAISTVVAELPKEASIVPSTAVVKETVTTPPATSDVPSYIPDNAPNNAILTDTKTNGGNVADLALEQAVTTAQAVTAPSSPKESKPSAGPLIPSASGIPTGLTSPKADVFKTAESAFLSLISKGADAISKGQTAGVPQAVPETSVQGESIPSVTDSSTVDIAAPKEIQKKEEDKKEKSVESKTAAKKSTPDKETAKERQELIEAEKIYQQGITTIRDLIAPSSMEIKYDMIRVEGMYAQTFYVYAYPRYLETNWLSPIINFDVTMDIAQFIYPIDSGTIMRVLKKKVAQMQASVRINAEKGMVSDPSLETALQDAEELRISITRGQEKFFQFALYFTIYSEDDKKISKIAKQLESILGGKLILTKKSELQMEHGFNSCLPLCLDELEVALNMNTSPLSSTFPFSSSDLTSNEGILYGLNRHNDSLIIFDRFSLENANSVVFAKSGAGKSYCVKLEVLRAMMVGTDVIIIDPENEYEALAQTVGGAYLRVSLTSDRRINPFDLPAPIEGEEVQPGDLLRSNIINLHGLLKIMLGGITPEEEGIMDKALNDVYAIKGITMDIIDPSAVAPPTMEDLYDILSTMEGGTSLAQRLQKFTSGTYSGIFNKPTNVDLESGLMVFSIRDLEDALRPIAIYIILNYIWSRIRRKLKKRILVIDEAWSLMQHEDSAKFLFGLVKRARKYYLGITTITQDVEDFVKSPYGKPVVTNSSMQLLLKQAPAAIDVLGKVFNLTDGEKYMLLNSGVGQGLFFAGLKHVAIQIIASYTEDKIVTTNPEEILKGRDTGEVYDSATTA
jgi:conjugal transfer ATP-binding protein TraC